MVVFYDDDVKTNEKKKTAKATVVSDCRPNCRILSRKRTTTRTSQLKIPTRVTSWRYRVREARPARIETSTAGNNRTVQHKYGATRVN